MLLAVLCWFGLDDTRVDKLAEHVAAQQMADGGWNCRAMPGYGEATHGSFHTTILALEGLLEYARFRGRGIEASARGREFLLAHRLFRSHRTDAVARPEFTRFAFPPRWHYDALRGLDHFREAGAPRDERLTDVIEPVEKRRAADGRGCYKTAIQVRRFSRWRIPANRTAGLRCAREAIREAARRVRVGDGRSLPRRGRRTAFARRRLRPDSAISPRSSQEGENRWVPEASDDEVSVRKVLFGTRVVLDVRLDRRPDGRCRGGGLGGRRDRGRGAIGGLRLHRDARPEGISRISGALPHA
jgi:hypothetical protein